MASMSRRKGGSGGAARSRSGVSVLGHPAFGRMLAQTLLGTLVLIGWWGPRLLQQQAARAPRLAHALQLHAHTVVTVFAVLRGTAVLLLVVSGLTLLWHLVVLVVASRAPLRDAGVWLHIRAPRPLETRDEVVPAAMVALLSGVHGALGSPRRVPFPATRRRLALEWWGVPNERVRMGIWVTKPRRTAEVGFAELFRKQLRGLVDGIEVRRATDPLGQALTTPGVLVSQSYRLRRASDFPLRDLASEEDLDVLAPLLGALQPGQGSSLLGIQVILTPAAPGGRAIGQFRARQWKSRSTTRMDDTLRLGAEALSEKAAQPQCHVTLRVVCHAANAQDAAGQLAAVEATLHQFNRHTGLRHQGWRRTGRRTSAVTGRTDAALTTASLQHQLVSSLIVGLAGGAFGVLVALGVHRLPAVPLSVWVPTVPAGIGAAVAAAPRLLLPLAGVLSGLTLLPARRAARTQRGLARLAARSAAYQAPSATLLPLPLPGRAVAALGVREIGSMWHLVTRQTMHLVDARPNRWIDPPAAVLQAAQRAALAPSGTAAQRAVAPDNPLNQALIRLARSVRPDGTACDISIPIQTVQLGFEVVGGMGGGKTYFMKNFPWGALEHRLGFGLLDFKRDFAEDVLRDFIALDREADVCWFDVTDADWPIGMNILDSRLIERGVPRGVQVASLLDVFAKFDPNWDSATSMRPLAAWGALALVEGEPNRTLAHLGRFFASEAYRATVLERITDLPTLDFWRMRYPHANEATGNSVQSLQKRIDGWIQEPLIRHIIAQPHSTIDLERHIEQGGIFDRAAGRGGAERYRHVPGHAGAELCDCLRLCPAAAAAERAQPMAVDYGRGPICRLDLAGGD